MRRGGFAAVHDERGGVTVYLSLDANAKLTELGEWALLAIEQGGFRRVKDGPAEGLATVKIKPSYAGSVLDWCDRDSIHEGPTRTIHLDCLECGACCHDANVLLDDDDFNRWKAAGREDLLGKDYLKRSRDGKVTLRFAKSGCCQNLQSDNKCSIYEIRPDNCRVFVVGSEACLAAREDTLGIREGAPAED